MPISRTTDSYCDLGSALYIFLIFVACLQTVDLQTAKQVMDFYLQLASQIPFSKHADLILRAISSRMIQVLY